LKVDVFQGETRRCSQNQMVGTFDVTLEPLPAGSPVEVVFAYDLDGVVRVTVKQLGTRNEKTVQLRLADAGEAALSTPVLRRARALLEGLEAEPKGELAGLIAAYESAGPADRERAEEALLDFFLDLDDEDENGDGA
jgi:molecular chaperone DnaK